jgi:hypothetical protein
VRAWEGLVQDSGVPVSPLLGGTSGGHSQHPFSTPTARATEPDLLAFGPGNLAEPQATPETPSLFLLITVVIGAVLKSGFSYFLVDF